MFPQTEYTVTLPAYIKQVLQGNLGATDNLDLEEIRIYKENSSYYYRINDGTSSVLINPVVFGIDKPYIKADRFYQGTQAVVVYHAETLAANPTVIVTPQTNQVFCSVSSVTTTQFKIYQYDTNSVFSPGNINYLVIGERP